MQTLLSVGGWFFGWVAFPCTQVGCGGWRPASSGDVRVVQITDEQTAQILELGKQPNIRDRIIASMAPSIYGMRPEMQRRTSSKKHLHSEISPTSAFPHLLHKGARQLEAIENRLKKKNPERNCIHAPHPPSTHVWPQGNIFRGGGGVYILKSPVAGI